MAHKVSPKGAGAGLSHFETLISLRASPGPGGSEPFCTTLCGVGVLESLTLEMSLKFSRLSVFCRSVLSADSHLLANMNLGRF